MKRFVISIFFLLALVALASTAPAGDWGYLRGKSIYNLPAVTAHLHSKINFTTPRGPLPGTLLIYCEKGGGGMGAVGFAIPKEIEFVDTDVQYRFDKGEVFTDTWKNRGTVMTPGTIPKVVDFLNKIKGKKQLAIRFDSAQKPPKDMLFDLDGFDEVLQELRNTCDMKI